MQPERTTGRNERGFTLPELMIVMVLMGILAAMAVPSFRGVTEGGNVDSAANQLAADMRLAHSSATNRLSSSYVVFRRDGAPVTNCNGATADYCLVRPENGTQRAVARYFPGSNYSASPASRQIRLFSSNASLDPSGFSVPGLSVSIPGQTSTLEFGSDGSVKLSGVPVSSPVLTTRVKGDTTLVSQTCAAARTKPCHDINLTPATSQVNVD